MWVDDSCSCACAHVRSRACVLLFMIQWSQGAGSICIQMGSSKMKGTMERKGPLNNRNSLVITVEVTPQVVKGSS